MKTSLTQMFSQVVRGQATGAAGWAATAALISILTGIMTARTLGPENRGSLALVVSIAGLSVLVGAFGTNVAIRRHLPRRRLVNRRGYARASGILIIPLVIILLSILYVVTTVVDPTFGRWPVGVSFIAYGIFYYFSNQALDLLNALGLVRVSAKVNALGSLICLALVAVCAMNGLGLEFIVWAYAISVACQAVVALIIIRQQASDPILGVKGVRVLFADGGRLLGLNLGQTLAFQGGTIVLGMLSGAHQVGIYAIAVTPAAILRIPANALGQVLFHDIASGTIGPRTVILRVGSIFALLLPLAILGWSLADWLVPMVFGAIYEDAVWPFRFLLIAEVLLTPFLILGRALAANGKVWSASTCGILGVIVLVVGCWLLVPALGASGAALASVVAYGSMSGLAILLFARARSSCVNSAAVTQ